MDCTTQAYIEDLHAEDKDLKYKAYNQIMFGRMSRTVGRKN